MIHELGGGVDGVEGLKLVVSGSVGELKLGVDGVGGSDSVVGRSVVGLGGALYVGIWLAVLGQVSRLQWEWGRW